MRVARIEGQFVVNPSRTELAKADMDFLIGATSKNLMMVEGEGNECSEEDMVKALEIAHDAIRLQIKAQEELRAKKGVTGKEIIQNLSKMQSCNKKWLILQRIKYTRSAARLLQNTIEAMLLMTLKEELITSLGEEAGRQCEKAG